MRASRLGDTQIKMVTHAKAAAMGRDKNASILPSALIIDVMKLSSSMPPSTTPNIAGAIGNLLDSKT